MEVKDLERIGQIVLWVGDSMNVLFSL